MLGLLRRLDRPVVVILAVTALAGIVRFTHLSNPAGFVFDELYYPKAACIMVGLDDETCRLDDTEKLFREQRWDVGSYVHPDLGKWQIALGIKAFGMDPFGWRAATAAAGTLVVLVVAVMAQLLFRSTVWTAVAGLLAALEHLSVVLSRTALLDMHLQLWVAVAFCFLLLDRRWLDRRVAGRAPTPEGDRPSPVYSPVWRPWRFAAGAAFGAAVAVKWSGAYAIVGAVLLVYVWETSRRRRSDMGSTRALGRAVARESFGVLFALAIVPLLVYTATWLPWLHHTGHNVLRDPVTSVTALANEHADMWAYHGQDLQEFGEDDEGVRTPTHPYYSRPWRWPMMLRPVLFYSEDLGPDIAQVLAIGNPALFWGCLIALPYLAFAWRRQRDWRAGFLLVAYLAQWLPWFAVARPQFFFYALPLVPFMVLGMTYLLRHLADARIVLRDPGTGEVALDPETGAPAVSRQRPYLPFVVGYVVAAVALFVWFWPVLSAGRISDTHWRAIVWFEVWI